MSTHGLFTTMHLESLGLSAVKIETSHAVVVTDPFAPSVTSRPLRAKADIVTVSSPGSPLHNHVGAISGSPFVIDTPGEFEVKGVYIQGILLGPAPAPGSLAGEDGRAGGRQRARRSSEGAATPTMVFLFNVEGLRLAHLGGTRTPLSKPVLDALDGVDILFLPVGGGTTLDPERAVALANEIEPKLIIPMHYQLSRLRIPEKLLPVSSFLREMGVSTAEPVERLSVRKRDLGVDEMRVVILGPS